MDTWSVRHSSRVNLEPRVPKKVDVPKNLGTNGDGVGQIHFSPGQIQLGQLKLTQNFHKILNQIINILNVLTEGVHFLTENREILRT